MKKIISVVGARPNFMKVAPLHQAFLNYPDIRHLIVHTGQHYDEKMSKIFFDDLELPHPDIYLGVGSGSHAMQTAKIMVEFEKVLEEERPDLVIVVGDVNSTLACSVVSSKMGIPIAHVEAGLRSFDRRMPEEINRLVTDSLASYLFVSEPSGMDNLKKEGVDSSKVFFVGNIMIDSLIHFMEKARRSSIKDQLNLVDDKYIVVTLHRPSNVDTEENLNSLLEMFLKISHHCPIIFPVHPRTRKMIEQFNLSHATARNPNLLLTEPLGYLDFLNLLETAAAVITDSGGIQEETTYLGVPCLTMRENTERPITISMGTNLLMGFDYSAVVKEVDNIFGGKIKQGQIPELWDGRTAERIADHIYRKLFALL